MTVNEAVQHLTDAGVRQPVLFRINEQYFVKLDKVAMPLTDPSCFADCVDFLVHVFFVFNVDYPYELKLVYNFFEHILGMRPSFASNIVYDFMRSL
jgi:hypothetical protein